MAIGKRIRFFREQRGMTQKRLGMLVGFSEATASVRIAQYETGMRTPREELTATLARVLGVSPQALTAQDISSNAELMQTLFALEDSYGVVSANLGGEYCLMFRKDSIAADKLGVLDLLDEWVKKRGELNHGEITKAEYDQWRYNLQG